MPAQVWPAETKQALEYGFPLLGARNAACFGLCGENDAKRLLRSGATTLGGSIPTRGCSGTDPPSSPRSDRPDKGTKAEPRARWATS